MAEKNYSFTPYHYCSNNPISRIDPNGMLDDWYVNEENGDLYYDYDVHDETTPVPNENGKLSTYTRLGDNEMFGLDAITNDEGGLILEMSKGGESAKEFAEENGFTQVEETTTVTHKTINTFQEGGKNSYVKTTQGKNTKEAITYMPNDIANERIGTIESTTTIKVYNSADKDFITTETYYGLPGSKPKQTIKTTGDIVKAVINLFK